MCGIAGIVSFDGNIDNTLLNQMEASLKHRGPDGRGSLISNNVGLAMRRLSIIDVKGGDQPLFNEDKSIAIVGNGEIYNYIELQQELKKKGHKLRTGSDIETAIHAYEEWGLDAPKKFRGQFALAIYDSIKKRVILIRDRIGEKPIYYTKVGSKFFFASELKALIKIKDIDKRLNFQAINYFFQFYFIPEPFTPFRGVRKIKAGSMIVIDIKKKTEKEIIYWDPQKIKATKRSDPTRNIKKIFAEACKLTMRSDVPVGISLSGGVDSGSILAFSAPYYKSTMNAFSVGYEGTPPSDERGMAKELAKKFNVNFVEKEIKLKDVVDHFPNVIWNSDDPIADIAAHSIYEVSRLARKNGVKVLLGGVGGDELFWGYPSTIEAVEKNIKNSQGINRFINKKFFYNNPNPESTSTFISKIYTKSFKKSAEESSAKKLLNKFPKGSKNQIEKSVFNSVRELWLKSDVVTLGDRMSMAASVELRSPFLDQKLTEEVLKSKKAIAAYKAGPKYYFKKAMEGILPQEVMERPKRGFTPPVSQWLNAINKKYIHLLKNGFLVKAGIVDKNKIGIISTFLKAIPTYSIYQLLVMEIWGREYVLNQNLSSIK